jgi:hypothetical protein
MTQSPLHFVAPLMCRLSGGVRWLHASYASSVQIAPGVTETGYRNDENLNFVLTIETLAPLHPLFD